MVLTEKIPENLSECGNMDKMTILFIKLN